MALSDPGGILVLRMDVARTLRWLCYASLGMIGISALFVAAVTSGGHNEADNTVLDVAVVGIIFTGFLALFVFELAVWRNQRIRVDSSELSVRNMLGKPIRFRRALIDRLEQYRQPSTYLSRYGGTVLLTRVVCTDGRTSNLLRLSARNSRRLADFLGVRLVPPPTKTPLETLVQGFESIFGSSMGGELRKKVKDRLSPESTSRHD